VAWRLAQTQVSGVGAEAGRAGGGASAIQSVATAKTVREKVWS
jgi:hypothetical protein